MTSPPEIARIHDEIRATLGVPFVDPFFERMASVDGCLPWAWDCLAPFYRGGALHEAGARTAMIAQQIAMGRVDLHHGLRAEALADTLSAHVRAAPVNLIALLALARVCSGSPAAAPAMEPGSAVRLTPLAHILPVTELAVVPESSREKLHNLTALMTDGETETPLLLMQFAAWPTAMDAIAKVLRALRRADALVSVSQDMDVLARRSADSMALTYSPPAPAVAACVHRMAESLPATLARTIVVATALRQALL